MTRRKPCPPLRPIDCARQRREKQQQETVAILGALHARALRGEVIGMALFFRQPDGEEKLVLTGPYKANLAEAVNAAARMSFRLTGRQERADAEDRRK
jgi:hypothetical protein